MNYFDKETEKKIIDKILTDFSEESLEYLYEKLELNYSKTNKYLEFISLNERAHKIIDTLIKNKTEFCRDIWEIAWERINSNQFYKKANRIYSFTYNTMGDKTYSNMIDVLMHSWDNAVKKVKGLIKEDELLNGI